MTEQNNNDVVSQNSNLNILNVEYGNNDKYINITNKVKELFLKNNVLFIPKETKLDDIFDDPCVGIEKEIRIYAVLNGNPIRICEKESYYYLENDIIICEKNTVHILNIEYGINDKYINVTDKIKELFFKNNLLYIPKETNLYDLFNDPCIGVQKEIKIHAVLNDKIIHFSKKEYFYYLVNDIIIYTNFLNILSVEYGMNDKYIDVTNKVKDLFFKNNRLFIPKETNLNNIFYDPCIGVQKEIKIHAFFNNNPIYICEKENESYLENDINICTNILNVEYGKNDTYINVTDKVKELFLKNDQLHIPKETNLYDMFNDPCIGIEKEVKIHAFFNNKPLHICEKESYSHLENDIIISENNILNTNSDIYYNKPYENETVVDGSMFSLNTYNDYSNNTFISEDEVQKNLPRGEHKSKQKINIDVLEKCILIIDFNNAGGGTTVFIESIVSKYKNYQTFLIVRNFNQNVYFTINDDYELEKCYNHYDAYKLLLDNKHKIEKIFVNHILNHSVEFLNNLFNLNIEITTITHDFSCIFNRYQISFNDMNNYLNSEKNQGPININKYDRIITQNKANINIYNNFIQDKNKIVVSPLPDFKNPKDLIKTENNIIVIGIIGMISDIKGREELKKIVNFYKNRNDIKFVVLGTVWGYIESIINECVYENINDFNNLLITHKPNIIIELSIWPETYSYTLTLSIITQLPILYLNKNNHCPVQERLSRYDKAYSFNNLSELDNLIHDKKQDYFYTIEPVIYFNDFWNNYFITKKEKCINNSLNKNVFGINTYCVYFPQFHEIKENNKSFYQGFTDTQNLLLVSKCNLNIEIITPSLKELNINSINDYDYVKNKHILQKQIDIIYDYNISGFAIYYYWFSLNTITNKNTIMESVIDQFFNNSLDMKNRKVFFMWANESWTSNPAFGNTYDKIETNYSDINSIEKNINKLIKYFKNDNYLKIDNKPVFEIHHPWFINETELELYRNVLNNKCLENKFNGVHFIVNAINGNYTKYINKIHHLNYKKNSSTKYDENKKHNIIDYKNYTNNINEHNDGSIQTLVFDFDNRIRFFKPDKLSYSTVCFNNTELDKISFIKKIIKNYNRNKNSNVENILLINSWNEWGEKMAVEPSQEYGYYYLNLIKENLVEHS